MCVKSYSKLKVWTLLWTQYTEKTDETHSGGWLTDLYYIFSRLLMSNHNSRSVWSCRLASRSSPTNMAASSRPLEWRHFVEVNSCNIGGGHVCWGSYDGLKLRWLVRPLWVDLLETDWQNLWNWSIGQSSQTTRLLLVLCWNADWNACFNVSITSATCATSDTINQSISQTVTFITDETKRQWILKAKLQKQVPQSTNRFTMVLNKM